MNETIGCGKISNSGGARFASYFANFMFGRITINFCNGVAGLHRSDNFFNDGNINTMFGGVFGARSFNGLGFDFGKSNNMRSCITKMVVVLRICFSFRLSISRTLDNDGTASFADHFFAPMKE